MTQSRNREAGGPRAASGDRTGILVLCCLVQFTCLLDVTILNVALPTVRRDLGVSMLGLQWVISAYTLAVAGLLLLAGRAADLLGCRELFAAGLAMFGLASLAGGLAPDQTTLIAARAAQGAGAAALAPTGLAILSITYAEGAERNRALGWWGTLGGLGGASGALVGGVLTELLSWRWLLLVNAPICLVAALVALAVVPTPVRRTRAVGSFDLLGALTVTAGLVVLTYGIAGPGEHLLGSADRLVPIAVGAALLGLFLLIEERLAAAPLVPLDVLRSRAITGTCSIALCLGAVTFSMWFLLTLYLQQARGLSALRTGIAFAPMSLAIAVSTRLGSRLSTRLGPGRVAAAGMATLGTGMLLFSRADTDGPWMADVAVPSLLCATGIGCSFVPATIAANAGVSHEHAGLVSGLLNTAYQVGSSLGLALLAGIAATGAADGVATAGFRHAFAAGGAVALAGALVAIGVLVIPRPRAPGRRLRAGSAGRGRAAAARGGDGAFRVTP